MKQFNYTVPKLLRHNKLMNCDRASLLFAQNFKNTSGLSRLKLTYRN